MLALGHFRNARKRKRRIGIKRGLQERERERDEGLRHWILAGQGELDLRVLLACLSLFLSCASGLTCLLSGSCYVVVVQGARASAKNLFRRTMLERRQEFQKMSCHHSA